MASGQIVIKLNKKKFEPILQQLGIVFPSESTSELVAKCVHGCYHYTHIPMDCLGGKTAQDLLVENSNASSKDEFGQCRRLAYSQFMKDGTPKLTHECRLGKPKDTINVRLPKKILNLMEKLRDATGWYPSIEDAIMMNAFFVHEFLTAKTNGKTAAEMMYESLNMDGEEHLTQFMKRFMKWKNSDQK